MENLTTDFIGGLSQAFVSCFFVGLVAIVINCYSNSSTAAGQKNGQFNRKRNLKSTAEFAEHAEKNILNNLCDLGGEILLTMFHTSAASGRERPV